MSNMQYKTPCPPSLLFFSFFLYYFFLSRKILQQLSDLWCLRSVSMDIISSRFSSISTASWPSMINSPLQVYITDKRMPCTHFKENSEKKSVFLLSYATDFKSYLLPPCLFIAKPLILLSSIYSCIFTDAHSYSSSYIVYHTHS